MALALVALLLVGGCGDRGSGPSGAGPTASASASCRAEGPSRQVATADLDGDGTGDAVTSTPPRKGCPARLSAQVPGFEAGPPLDWQTPLAPGDAKVLNVPGRAGELLLLLERHPRGGFQAHLYGYADGRLAELQVGGRPVLPFVATDVSATPLAASCTQGGFTVTEAVAHQPVGVMPAWDVVRTAYAVDGNTVTKQGSEKIADNVLDAQLHHRYADLLSHSLFANCLVAR